MRILQKQIEKQRQKCYTYSCIFTKRTTLDADKKSNFQEEIFMIRYKSIRRLLATVLSLVLVIGMLPTTVFAENSWGGTGLAEVQKDPDSNTGLCAMGNNLVL